MFIIADINWFERWRFTCNDQANNCSLMAQPMKAVKWKKITYILWAFQLRSLPRRPICSWPFCSIHWLLEHTLIPIRAIIKSITVFRLDDTKIGTILNISYGKFLVIHRPRVWTWKFRKKFCELEQFKSFKTAEISLEFCCFFLSFFVVVKYILYMII